MEHTSAITTENLEKSYGTVRALQGVNLNVKQGEIFGFLGPNGAGKTTTIRCLLDLIRPDGGQIRVLGIDPQKDPVSVRARTGYLPGELHFDENSTVEAALRFLNRLRGGKSEWKYISQIAERLGLNLKIPIKNLSKGNKQKAGVLQAFMHRPELLMLDEPTFGLDPLIQMEVLTMVKEARASGATIFLSSHILSEVQQVCDRVGIIRQGEVVEVSETAMLVNRSMRRARVRFKERIDTAALERLPHVSVLTHEDGTSLTLQVEGEMDGLIKVLAQYPVLDFETEWPTLEEIFLAYYR